MSLIRPLASGALDIVGDIHGEYGALRNLLKHLGYTDDGVHEKGRSLVFVGDFCDRGPNSPGVLALVQRLVESGRAAAILGNHEINLLRDDAKDGSGWYFDERFESDHAKYAPFARSLEDERARIVTFLSSLPLSLERDDLRVVHAAWRSDEITALRALPGRVLHAFDAWEAQAKKRKTNPFKVLTSGMEYKTKAPFFAAGKWRQAQRLAWWDEYDEAVPVVVGHYWRRINKIDRTAAPGGYSDLFEETPPFAWHGKRRNVFCVDFSVGGRWLERKSGVPVGQEFKLAALRWPERELQFDDGIKVKTQ